MPSKVCLNSIQFNFFSYSAFISPTVDLIRHGKNHIHVRQGQDDFPISQQPAAPTTDVRSQPERRQQQQAEPQSQSQPKQQQGHKAQPATAKQSQHITREVEKIVREEREAMDKMPVYKGLERYRLIEKKGECVIFTRLIRLGVGRLTDFLCSGAFSNVYKALDLSLGTHVAGAPFPLPLPLMSPDPLNFASQSGSQVRTHSVTG
jgi:serine/threonine-protein kinase RCK2